jgi:hypothetical protein
MPACRYRCPAMVDTLRFGVIYLSAHSGAIVSAYFTHGVHGDERCFRGGREVRTVDPT